MTEKSYPLPFPSATSTQHTTDRCHRTANQNLVLLTEVGSTLHGVGVGDQDDLDMQGVCIEPPEVVLGTRQFDQYEYRTKGQGIRSGPGDIDLNVYSLSKWIRLIVNGNPSHLLPLFAPEDKVYALDWPGKELRASRHLFLAREHAKRFLGYLNKQRQHMLGELSPRVNRPELVEKYGLDTKYAYHSLRIAMQGIELMRDGEITLPMAAHQVKYLRDVRLGKYTLNEVLDKLSSLESDLRHASDNTVRLPERVDMDYVDAWLVRTYHRWWAERGLL